MERNVVLSSFSPVGSNTSNNRPKVSSNSNPGTLSTVTSFSSSTLGQIQPRNSTPVQPSAISRSVVNAAGDDESTIRDSGERNLESSNSRAGRLSMLLKTPIASSTRESLGTRPPILGGGNNVDNTEFGKSSSIMGRLSLPSRPENIQSIYPISEEQRPFTPLSSTSKPLKTLSSLLNYPDSESSATLDKTKSIQLPSETVKERFSGRFATLESNKPTELTQEKGKKDETVIPLTSISLTNEPLYKYQAISTVNDKITNAILKTNTQTHTSEASMNGIIRSLVEKSVTEAMAELRNDVQNLHVELIKQSLAQQTMLRQLASNVPDSYRKLAEENQSLREELERLKISKGRF